MWLLALLLAALPVDGQIKFHVLKTYESKEECTVDEARLVKDMQADKNGEKYTLVCLYKPEKPKGGGA